MNHSSHPFSALLEQLSALHGAAQGLQVPVGHGAKGEAQGTHLIAGQIQGGLDGNGVDLQKEGVNEVGVLDLERSGLPEPAPRLIMGTT